MKRSSNDRLIAGVCGGIAEHFGWDPTLVRIFFIFSGIGILPYIVLMILMPDY
ncbi:MAG: PspC domain-containing protein [Bacteroidota bacterium]